MMFQLQRVLVLALTHAVLRIQRWWRTLSDGLHVQVDMLALYWDKVDHMRVLETVAELLKKVATGLSVEARYHTVLYTAQLCGARFTEIAKKKLCIPLASLCCAMYRSEARKALFAEAKRVPECVPTSGAC